jgi:hypothetical protein
MDGPIIIYRCHNPALVTPAAVLGVEERLGFRQKAGSQTRHGVYSFNHIHANELMIDKSFDS